MFSRWIQFSSGDRIISRHSVLVAAWPRRPCCESSRVPPCLETSSPFPAIHAGAPGWGGGEVVGRRGRSGKWSRALSHRQKYQALNWDTQRETGLALGRLWQETRRSLSCLCSSRWLDGLVRSSQPVSLLVAICKSVTLDEGAASHYARDPVKRMKSLPLCVSND